MKVTALAALSVLAVLPAEAAQRHQVNGSSALTCDNDGHCTTFNVSALTSGLRRTRPAIKNAAAATQHPSPALDANSNSDTKKTTATVQPHGKLDGEVILLYTAPTRTACHDATWRSMVFPKIHRASVWGSPSDHSPWTATLPYHRRPWAFGGD